MSKYIPPYKRQGYIQPNELEIFKSKLIYDYEIDKPYMLSFYNKNNDIDSFDTIEIKPLLMDAIYLEYLLNNDKIYADKDNNIKIIDSVNLVKRTTKGKYIDRRGKTQSRKPVNVVRIPSESGDKIKLVSDEYLLDKEEDRKIYKLDTNCIDKSLDYYKSIIYYLIFKTFNYDYNQEEKYEFSDIHFTDDNGEIKEKENIIIKYLDQDQDITISDYYNSDSKYIIIGYPDNNKMINYNNKIYPNDTYLNEEINKKINTKINEQLIKRFHNLTTSDIDSIFTDEEISINDYNALWKILFYNKVLNKYYKEDEDKYKEYLNDKISDNNLLNQPLVECKYIFSLFKINNSDNSIELFKSLYDITPELTPILIKIKETINNVIINYLTNISESSINIYVNYSKQYQIIGEYINPMSNIPMFSYSTYNYITIDELIYSSKLYSNNGNPFWKDMNLSYYERPDNLIEEVNEDINLYGGTLLSPKEFNELSRNETQVILYKIDSLSRVSCILNNNNNYYYLLMYTNLNIDNYMKYQKYNEEINVNKNLNDNEFILIKNKNISPFKIIKFYSINDDENKKDLNSLFLRNKPMMHFIIPYDKISKRIYDKKYFNTIPFAIKQTIACNIIKDYENDYVIKDTIRILKADGTDFNEASSAESSSGEYLVLYNKKLFRDVNEELKINDEEIYVGWIIHSSHYLYIRNKIMENHRSSYDDFIKYITIVNDELPNDNLRIKDINDVNETNYKIIITLIDNVNKELNKKYNHEKYYFPNLHNTLEINFTMLHFKFLTVTNITLYDPLISFTKDIVPYSRNLSYNNFKNTLLTNSNYYKEKPISIFTPLTTLTYIYENEIENKSDIYMEGGNKKDISLIKLNKIKKLQDYSYLFSTLSYEEYISFINIYDTNYLSKQLRIDDIYHTKYTTILKNIHKLLNLHKNQKLISIKSYLEIKIFFETNNNKSNSNLLITPNPIIVSFLNQNLKKYELNNINVFLLYGDGIHNKEKDEFKTLNDEIYDMKFKKIYGSLIEKNLLEQFKELENKFDNIMTLTTPAFNINKNYNIILYSIIPNIIFNIIISLNLLKNNGNLFLHLKAHIPIPSIRKILNIIINCFDKTIISDNLLNLDIFINCYKFNRDYYDKIKDNLLSIAQEIIKINIYDKEKLVNITKDNLFYQSKSSNLSKSSKSSPLILHDIDIDIDIDISNEKLNSIIEYIKNVYVRYFTNINLKYIQYFPLTTEDNTKKIIDEIIYNNVTEYINILDLHNIPYNKYFTTLITDYNNDVLKSLYSLSEAPNSNIINYNSDVCKSVNKLDGNKYAVHKYDGFNKSVNKLMSTKHLHEYIISYDNLSQDIRIITEDFARGVNHYLYEKIKYFKNIKPSNAFSKLWEIYKTFNILPSGKSNVNEIKSFHMCEAPGQFIIATEHYISINSNNIKLNWLAESLNPWNKQNIKTFGNDIFGKDDEYNMIKKHNDKWIWGKDNTGDILNTENIIWFRDYFKDPNRKLDLITGDAGLPDNELFIYQKLDYSQFLLLISCASEGTNAVIKTFIPFMRTKSDSEDSDGYYVGLMYLYSLFFKEIHLYKPYTSRPSSGEYYIICKHFNSTCLTDDIYNKLINIHKNFVINQTFFKHNDIPDKFIVQLYNWIDNLASYNIKALERSYFFISCINDDDENIKKINNCDKLLDSKYIKEIKDKRYAAWWSLFSNPN